MVSCFAFDRLVRFVPATITGQTCAKMSFLQPNFTAQGLGLCEDICIEYDGPLNDKLRPISTWKQCGPNSKNKLRNQGCVFDKSLFSRTNGQYGYDFCSQTFEHVLIVMEDFFDVFTGMDSTNPYELDRAMREYGMPTLTGQIKMQSALWHKVSTQAGISDACGAASGKLALVFSGDTERFAETKPLNVSSGGYVRFKLKYGPDEDPLCNEMQGSDDKELLFALTHFKYSIDFGGNWTTLTYYKMRDIKSNGWVLIDEPIPEEAITDHTMFRWDQVAFNKYGDYWALDDVQVKRNFKQGWLGEKQQREVAKKSHAFTRDTQCCLDSYQCPAWSVESPRFHKKADKLPPGSWMHETKQQTTCEHWEETDGNNGHNLKGRELFVIIAVMFMALQMQVKGIIFMLSHNMHIPGGEFFYGIYKGWLDGMSGAVHKLKNRGKARPKIVAESDLPPTPFDARFEGIVDQDVRRVFYGVTVVSCSVIAFSLIFSLTYNPIRIALQMKILGPRHEKQEILLPHFVIATLAMVVDVYQLMHIGNHNLCVPESHRPHVQVFARSNKIVISGEEEISLSDIQSTSAFTKFECKLMAASYYYMALPWCSMCLLCGDRTMSFAMGVHAVLRTTFGACVILRSWVVGRYIFTALVFWNSKFDEVQIEFGNVLMRWCVFWMGIYWCVLGTTVGMFILLFAEPGPNTGKFDLLQARPVDFEADFWTYDEPGTWTLDEVMFRFICIVVSTFLFGVSIAVIQGLPCQPTIHITKFELGKAILYTKRPNLSNKAGHGYYSHIYCGKVQKCQAFLILFVDDQIKLEMIMDGQDDSMMDVKSLPEDSNPFA